MKLENEDLKKLATCDESCTIIGYTNEYCYKLGLSEEVREKCAELSNKVVEKGLTHGRNRKIIAVAITYIGSISRCEDKTQREITKIAGVSVEGTQKRYKEIAEKFEVAELLE